MNENDLIKQNIGLVKTIVKKFKPKPNDYEDYEQIACIGLLKAIRKYDENKGQLTTLAWKIIVNDLVRYKKRQIRQSSKLVLCEDLEKSYTEHAPHDYNYDYLTKRQVNILELKQEGFKIKEIAKKLDLKESETFLTFQRAVQLIKKHEKTNSL